MVQFSAKKSLGQNFLNNPHIPKLMADAGGVVHGDVVVEIGPGTGMLTRELLARGAKVIALEADIRAVEILNELFHDEIMAQRLVISHIDVRRFDIATLGLRPSAYKVVANIPYYLSGMLFRIFLEHPIYPSQLVFLVQKEVAERIARDKKESLLSLSVKVFGDPVYIKTIKRGNFSPAPKVDSAIIAVNTISHSRFENIPLDFFFRILHEGFKSKRKQLLGNLCEIYPREKLTEIFDSLSLPLNIRGEDVTLTQWLVLCKVLNT